MKFLHVFLFVAILIAAVVATASKKGAFVEREFSLKKCFKCVKKCATKPFRKLFGNQGIRYQQLPCEDCQKLAEYPDGFLCKKK
uniref:Gibberellin regulated protein n=1 Tax=Panagrellus redivivus TaxID=6233 RepID=A0A7E4VM62_PANRE